VVIASSCWRTFVAATGLKRIHYLMTKVKMEHQEQKPHITPFIAVMGRRKKVIGPKDIYII